MEYMAEPTNLDWRFKGECGKDPEPFNPLPNISLTGGEALIRTQIEDIESEIGTELHMTNDEGEIDREALVDVHVFIKDINERRTKAAKAICRACDVREKCLEWALERGESAGVWGGLTERERNKLNKRRFRIAS
jgi:hypothetical protein